MRGGADTIMEKARGEKLYETLRCFVDYLESSVHQRTSRNCSARHGAPPSFCISDRFNYDMHIFPSSGELLSIRDNCWNGGCPDASARSPGKSRTLVYINMI